MVELPEITVKAKRKEAISKKPYFSHLFGSRFYKPISYKAHHDNIAVTFIIIWGTQTTWRNTIEVWREDSQAEKTDSEQCSSYMGDSVYAPLASTDLESMDILILMYITFKLYKPQLIFFSSMNLLGCTLNPFKL